jgi:hypothetical protein
MSMYLPNPDVRPTGAEPGEFIEPDLPRAVVDGVDAVDAVDPGPQARRLDPQTRVDITRWAEEYISDLVAENDGNPEDVRSIIRGLHQQALGHPDRLRRRATAISRDRPG